MRTKRHFALGGRAIQRAGARFAGDLVQFASTGLHRCCGSMYSACILVALQDLRWTLGPMYERRQAVANRVAETASLAIMSSLPPKLGPKHQSTLLFPGELCEHSCGDHGRTTGALTTGYNKCTCRDNYSGEADSSCLPHSEMNILRSRQGNSAQAAAAPTVVPSARSSGPSRGLACAMTSPGPGRRVRSMHANTRLKRKQ